MGTTTIQRGPYAVETRTVEVFAVETREHGIWTVRVLLDTVEKAQREARLRVNPHFGTGFDRCNVRIKPKTVLA